MLFSTPPIPILDFPADHVHSGGKRTMPPQFIVLHHTGPYPALHWLTTDPKSDVSAHRYIEPGVPIYKLVPDDHVAYTQGFADVGPWSDAKPRNFNSVALSIEGCFDPSKGVPWSDDVVWKMAVQCTEWIGLYGMLPIVYHGQVDDRKDDPARFPRVTFDTYLVDLVSRAWLGKLPSWSKS